MPLHKHTQHEHFKQFNTLHHRLVQATETNSKRMKLLQDNTTRQCEARMALVQKRRMCEERQHHLLQELSKAQKCINTINEQLAVALQNESKTLLDTHHNIHSRIRLCSHTNRFNQVLIEQLKPNDDDDEMMENTTTKHQKKARSQFKPDVVINISRMAMRHSQQCANQAEHYADWAKDDRKAYDERTKWTANDWQAQLMTIQDVDSRREYWGKLSNMGWCEQKLVLDAQNQVGNDNGRFQLESERTYAFRDDTRLPLKPDENESRIVGANTVISLQQMDWSKGVSYMIQQLVPKSMTLQNIRNAVLAYTGKKRLSKKYYALRKTTPRWTSNVQDNFNHYFQNHHRELYEKLISV